jgi:hypothetical protein
MLFDYHLHDHKLRKLRISSGMPRVELQLTLGRGFLQSLPTHYSMNQMLQRHDTPHVMGGKMMVSMSRRGRCCTVPTSAHRITNTDDVGAKKDF